jgi:hypothetical protein
MTEEERKKKMQKLIEDYNNEWRTPIEFYGIVVDESNNPVADVQVDFSCNDMSPTGTSNYHAVSDENGFFSLKNVTGKLLVITGIAKSGYYTSRNDNNSFEYGDAHITSIGNPNPIVFHLRKKGEGANLIEKKFPLGIGQIWQLRHDGTPIELDLLNGSQNISGNGQLKLEFWRDISDKHAQKFDWKLQVTMLNGGFIGTDEEFPFNAPENGYQSPIVMDMSTNNPNWQGNVNTNYYFQLPDGKYGRMDFQFLPYNGVFTIHSYVNPTGSRDLESK